MKKLLVAIAAFTATSFAPKKTTWVAVGDSITYLNEHLNETANRVTKGYMTRVVEKLPDITYVNQGHNGWTSGDMAKNIDKIGLAKAEIYSVFLGTNDWWHGRLLGAYSDYENNTGNNTIYGSFRIIINKLRNLNNEAKIILVTPMQRGDFVYVNDPKNNAWGSYKPKNGLLLSQVVDAIDSIGMREKFTVVDLYHKSGINKKNMVKYKRLKNPKTGEYENYKYPNFIDVPFDPTKDEYPYPVDAIGMTYDGLHPSDKGYAKIAKMLLKVLKK